MNAELPGRGGRLPVRHGLTGTGYGGHTFWDTETFVPPVLTYTRPRAARDALAWRHATLPEARRHAADLALAGAAFAWRTVQGQECSGYWPTGTAAFHVNADIADAVLRYPDATEDTEFERQAARIAGRVRATVVLAGPARRCWPVPDRGRDRAG